MAWTYSGNPATSTKDTVRYFVGDTQLDSPLTTDEEIAWALSQTGDEVYAAAVCVAKAISAYFSTLAETTEIGPIKIQYGKRAETYEKKAVDLDNRASTQFSSIIPYAGGISQSDKDSVDQDNATVFRIGQNDITGTLTPIDPTTEL